MSTKLAPNKQATQSLDVQHIELPADLPQSAVQSAIVPFLCRVDGGGFAAECSEVLQQAAHAAYTLNKKAKVTISFEFAPGGPRKMDIKPSVAAKIPKEERASTMLFIDERTGQLLAYDPDQQRMDLRVVKTTDVPSKIIDIHTDEPRDVLAAS